ncbi:MAG: (2Fe-2S) ferredoxin domain-containing protein [Candidatus Gracilibacteria bacterium]
MKINVCKGKICDGRFSSYILTRLKNDKKRFNLKNLIIEERECMGICDKGPNIEIDGKAINHMNPAKASEIVLKNNKKKK